MPRRGDKVSFRTTIEPRAPDFPFMKVEAPGDVPFLARSGAEDELASRSNVGSVAAAPGSAVVRDCPGAARPDAKRAGGAIPRPLEARFA